MFCFAMSEESSGAHYEEKVVMGFHDESKGIFSLFSSI